MIKSVKTLAITLFIVCALAIGHTFAILQSSTTVGNTGFIQGGSNSNYRFRIADFMVDILPPIMSSQGYANAWQTALNDLKAASPNGEITHVQMRTFWKLPGTTAPDTSNATSWNYPTEGAYDTQNLPGGQIGMSANWRSWIFGNPAPAYTCAAQRIHDAGFHIEFCLGAAWGGSDTMAGVIPVFHGSSESSYPAFNGTTFLTNYMNILRSMAQFLASSPNFGNDDIFMLQFEGCYPYCDFSWNHNAQWISMIDEIRQIFVSAGKPGVLLTIDNTGWYDDTGLGYDGLNKLIQAGLAKPNPISSSYKGFTGAKYYSHLDFVSISGWISLLQSSQIPATWSTSYVDSLVVPAWHNTTWYPYPGTNWGTMGRDMTNDYWAVSQVLGVPVLLNSGWTSGHTILASGNPASGGGGSYDPVSQEVAWMAQIRALGGDSRGWCAGQDFERYCENKASGTSVNTSWRNALAQTAIIQEIDNLLGL